MATQKTKAFSITSFVILFLFDVVIINFFAFNLLDLGDEKVYFFQNDFLNDKRVLFASFSLLSWILITYVLNFYKVYRYMSMLNIMSLIVKQLTLFSLSIYAFIGIFRSININAFTTLKYIGIVGLIIALVKISWHYGLKKYRYYVKGYLKQVLIIGNTENTQDFKRMLSTNKNLGYHIIGVFSNNFKDGIAGNIREGLNFIMLNDTIDEIYCAMDELTEDEVNEFVKQAATKNIELKFIPEGQKQYLKSLKTDYYAYIPVLSIDKPALNQSINQIIKRIFDVIFSVFIIVFIISWLVPICALLIKIESKGSVFFKHTRHGINYKEFTCYKLRSLKTQNSKEIRQVEEGDLRITKFGRFLRRTSIDELPQFFNVLLGDMSVVGPRPHMLPFTSEYSKKIDKYIFTYRHSVKPGITGLAQIKGCRGEIKKDEDIINRVKYDVFYIENWSLLLDIKIIFQTFFNIVKGEENAY